jgi:hypothetical protein
MRNLALVILALCLGACSAICPPPLSRDWMGRCSQRGGM